MAAGVVMLGLSLTVTPATTAPAAAEEPVQVGVNVVNKLDVALAVGPTSVDYSTFEADLRAQLKNYPIPVADEDLYITAAKTVSANTTREFQWWTYDHTIPTTAQQPTRTDTDGGGTAFNSAAYPSYQTFYNYVIQQAKLGAARTWTGPGAPTDEQLAPYALMDESDNYFAVNDAATRTYIDNSVGARRTGTHDPSRGYVQSTDPTSPVFGPTNPTTGQTHPYDGNMFHMVESDGGARMDFYGYGTSANKDFRYLPNNQKTRKSFEFSIEEFLAYDALDGVGFFFNTYIDEHKPYTCSADGQTMTGYLLFLGYSTSGVGANLNIYKFQDVNTCRFHNAMSSTSATNPAAPQTTNNLIESYKEGSETNKFTRVARAPYSSADRSRRIRLDVYPTYVSVYYAGSTTSSDAAVLSTPIADGASPVSFTSGATGTKVDLDPSYVKSYGFGPMASYRSHSCARATAIAMQNISMTMDKVKTLVEVVDEPEWSDNTEKFLVNLNEDTIPDFEEANITARLLNRLRNDDIYYIGWATQANVEKSVDFLEKNSLKGTVVNMTQDNHDPREVYAPKYQEQIKAIADEIYAQYRVENVGDVVLTTDNVVLDVTGADQTGTADAQYPDGRWKVVHRTSGSDPLTPPERTGDDDFSDDEGIQPWSGLTGPDLDVQFDKPGYYDLYYRDQYLKTITAQRPPTASFTVAQDSGGGVTFTNTSVDPDFGDDLTVSCTPLITDTCSQWKHLDLDTDSKPVDGFPHTLVEGHTYIVYITVTNRYGTPVSISKQVRYVATPDEECDGSSCDTVPDYVAPFADFALTPTRILPWGDNVRTVTLTNSSYDPQGFAVTSAFTLTRDGLPIASPFGSGWEEGDIDVAGWPVGEYAISLVVANGKKDANGNGLVSTPYVLSFTVVEDTAAPTATADPVPGTHVGNTTVTLRLSDVGDAGLATQRVAVTTSAEPPASGDAAWTATSTSATRPVTVSQTGSYIHWEATDRAGNVGAGRFGPYTIDKNPTTPSLTASPDSVTFGAGTLTLTATFGSTTPSGSVHFYADDAYIGSGTISGGVATLVYTPTTAGNVTFTAEYGGDGSHHGSTATRTTTIERSGDVSVTVGEQVDKAYDGQPFTPTGIVVTTGGTPSSAYSLSYEGTQDGAPYAPTAAAPTEAGRYTVTVTTTDPRYVETTGSAAFTIAKAEQRPLRVTGLSATYEVDTTTPPTATLDTDGGSGEGTVSYQITAEEPAGTARLVGSTVTMNAVGTFTVTATKAGDRNHEPTTATVDVTVVDTTAPTGTVTATSSVTPVGPTGVTTWGDHAASPTFDRFSLGTATFAVEVADNSGDAVSVAYHLSDEALTAAEIAGPDITWTPYTEPVVRTSTWKGLVYARLVDPSGNSRYIGSSGVVVYTDVVQRTASSSTTRYSTTDLKVPLTFNGNTVADVDVSDVPVGAPTPPTSSAWSVDYTGATPGITFSGSFLSGLRVGAYTFEVTYDPLGEPFVPDSWNMAPATTTVTVTVSPVNPTVSLTAAAQTSAARHAEAVTLTASVAGVDGSTPTGTVSFYAVTASEPCGQGTPLSTQPWGGSSVTTTVDRLGATTHTFCAVYSGDDDHASATDTTSLQINDWLTAVSLAKPPTQVVYRYGEPLAPAGGVLDLTWSDRTGAATVDLADLPASAFTGYSPTRLGQQTVTVTYAGRTATFAVTVVDYQVGVVLVTPAKTAYEWGDPLLVAGGSIAQKMASGAVQGHVPLTTAMVFGFTSTQEGRQTLAVTTDWGEGGFSGDFTVDVVDPVLEIRVKTPPDKTRYAPGEPLDLTGGEIEVVKKSGTYPMSMTDAMASGYVSVQEGSQTIMISHAGKQASFAVLVVDPDDPGDGTAGGPGGGSDNGSGDRSGDSGGVSPDPTGYDDSAADGRLDVTEVPGTAVEEIETARRAAETVVQEPDGSWAPLDVVLVAAGLVLTVGGAARLRRRQADSAGYRRRRAAGVVVSAVATLFGAVVLLLELDVSGQAVVVDRWTPLLFATFVASLGGLVWSARRRSDTADPVAA